MTEKEQKRRGSQTPTPVYRYRWSYGEQRAFDESLAKKKKRSGIAVYAVIMTVVFSICFLLLAGSLIWYGTRLPIVSEENGETQAPATGGMSVGDVAEAVKPCTVLIYASGTTSYGYGTGFFIRENGYIATNQHVLEGRNRFSVTLYSGEVLEAEVVGLSRDDDLAVLKIDGHGYPVLPVGDSDALRVGDMAIAVGNPSGKEAPWTTTVGIISALDRKVEITSSNTINTLTMIQTDAALNPGNSGGPLCNDRGEVIGVVARKLTDTEGISFAIPINGAMEILEAILEKGNANSVDSSVSQVRPTIGITAASIKAGDPYTYGGESYIAGRDGVLVSTVDASGSAAGKLKVADIIIAMNGESVPDMDTLIEMLYACKVGDTAVFTVWRNGAEAMVSVTLGK